MRLRLALHRQGIEAASVHQARIARQLVQQRLWNRVLDDDAGKQTFNERLASAIACAMHHCPEARYLGIANEA